MNNGFNDLYKMLHTPIYTGTPGEPPKSRPREKTNDNAFKELLEQRLKEESQVSFSKHAMERVVERGVDVSHAGGYGGTQTGKPLEINTFYFHRKEVRRWLFFVLKRPVIIRSCRTIT